MARYYSQEPKRYAEKLAQLSGLLQESETAKKAAGKERETILLADTLRLMGKKDEAAKILQAAATNFRLTKDRGSILTAATLLEAGPAADGRMVVLADGKPVGAIQAKPNETATLTLKEDIAGKKLAIRSEGNLGDCFWSARVEGHLSQPPAPPPQPAVELICRVFEGDKEIKADETGAIQLKPGVTCKVRLECDLTADLNYVRVSFPRPCGVELAGAGASKLKQQRVVKPNQPGNSNTHDF
ncbi:MAG: hypothetical protein V1899_09710 [Planctomycetota bacterium]